MMVIWCFSCRSTIDPSHQRDDGTLVVDVASYSSRVSGVFRSKCIGSGVSVQV